ncbi:OmpH family outer membrane protein [Fulvivirgaceae bacterium BMA10]|uniref:OmpH family outer membrane protein n=1 Tax=Splendidivirga corallicola TaxID=3051826 RepID=A0ABT8KV71_9BACT|nr:OmpH family outer membrane protein [Fulvivirgaceae bacterium BMA10]
MKTKLLIGALALFVTFGVNAQSTELKIGYTSTEYILSLLPAAKQIQKELEDYNNQLTNQLKSKEQTLQEKYQIYQRDLPTMTDVIRKDKEREIQSLENSLRQFQADAQKSFQEKQVALLQPVLENIREAIQNVAKEHNFTHVFNSSSGGMDVLLFAKEENDISDLVLAKLGVAKEENQ